MRATFSFSRFIQLIRKQWIENFRLYLFSVLALIGILGIVLIFWMSSDNNFKEETLYIIFTFGMYIAGGVFASMSFSMLGEKDKGTFWLGLPASHLEKLLCTIFYNLIVFTLVYCACFFMLKTLAITYIQNLIAVNPTKYHYSLMDWNDKNGFNNVLPFFMYSFFAVQAFYLMGSVYFSRFSFVLTTVVGVALFGGFIWYAFSLSKIMIPSRFDWQFKTYVDDRWIHKISNTPNDNNFNRYQLSDNTFILGDYTFNRYQLSNMFIDVLSFLIKFIWAPVFWIAAWYRLKEKEI